MTLVKIEAKNITLLTHNECCLKFKKNDFDFIF